MKYIDKKIHLESSTIPNFAKRHSISISTVYRLIKDGELTTKKIRGLTRILHSDELLWINSLKEDIKNK